MSDSFRHDPYDDGSGDLSKSDRKRLKRERKDRKRDDTILDNQMRPEGDEMSTSDKILSDVLEGGWDRD